MATHDKSIYTYLDKHIKLSKLPSLKILVINIKSMMWLLLIKGNSFHKLFKFVNN